MTGTANRHRPNVGIQNSTIQLWFRDRDEPYQLASGDALKLMRDLLDVVLILEGDK